MALVDFSPGSGWFCSLLDKSIGTIRVVLQLFPEAVTLQKFLEQVWQLPNIRKRQQEMDALMAASSRR